MQEIDRFEAQSESGARYTIVEYGSRHDATHLGGRASIAGMSELRTTDGSAVTDRGDGTFKIIQTGEIVRRVD